MSPILRLFGFTIQVYPLSLLLGIWIGLWLAAREAQRMTGDGEKVNNLGFYTLVATVLGARLIYVLSHWFAYRDGLLSALAPTPTALAWPQGALIGGIVAIVYWNRNQLPVGTTLDALALGLTAGLALERVGAFFDGRDFGAPTTLPWGVPLWNEIRHPVQLYEAIGLLAILAILWSRRERRPFDGHSFLLFVALAAGLRTFLEPFRAETATMANGVRTVQVVALTILLGAVGILYRRRFAVSESPPKDNGGELSDAVA
jgi:phosphatidylglycerol:prolipoprotein diacylglycerol transferase